MCGVDEFRVFRDIDPAVHRHGLCRAAGRENGVRDIVIRNRGADFGEDLFGDPWTDRGSLAHLAGKKGLTEALERRAINAANRVGRAEDAAGLASVAALSALTEQLRQHDKPQISRSGFVPMIRIAAFNCWISPQTFVTVPFFS